MFPTRCRFLLGAACWILHSTLGATDLLRIATYNVENYIGETGGSRPVKSEEAKAKVCESIRALTPDVLALEEMGGANALLELQASLKKSGLDLPYWEHVTGYDTNIHVAVLSRFPILARHPHTNDSFLLAGRRFRVSRGFAEVDIRANAGYSFALIAAHLKSRRAIPEADEADFRLEEAKILRDWIDARLRAEPNLNLIVLGDLNDLRDSAPIKTILSRGRKALVDTRPAERNGERAPHSDPRSAAREITWTHFYAKEDTYSRIDHIFLSHNMARSWDTKESYVLALPDWGLASDHRPIVAAFDVGNGP
jgi:endonuclease/exonuclease/phosphatase family metal-dependent hydrolase